MAGHARVFYGDDLESVWLYGSRARGDNRADSDLDVLLVREPPTGLSPAEASRDRVDERFQDYLEAEMEGYSVLFTLIRINSARPRQLDRWDTMFFRSVREDGIRVL